jgi:hypothetical protein
MGYASKVDNKEVPPSQKSLVPKEFDIPMLPAIALWGPINTVTDVYDWDSFYRRYRGFMSAYESPAQVHQYYINRGTGRMLVNRIVHIDSSGNPVTAAKASKTVQTASAVASAASVTGTETAPFALANGDTFVGAVDQQANQTATIAATAADVETGNAETYALVDGQNITVKIDREAVAQTITFLTAEFVDIANATAEEVVNVINTKISGASCSGSSGDTKATITSDRKGTGSYVEVTGGTANTALGFPTAEQSTVGGNVSNVASVTVAELKTIIEAAWTNSGGVTVTDVSSTVKIESNTAGASSYIQVIASSTGDDEVGLDNVEHQGSDGTAQNTLTVRGKYEGGTVGNAITFDIADASSAIAAEFNITVYVSGVKDKTTENLTMDSTASNYVATVLAADKEESMLVDAVDVGLSGTALEKRPANGTGLQLTGGDDGLTDLEDADFVGTQANGTGFFAFTRVEPGDVLFCPDRPTTTVINAMVTFLETTLKRKATGIPDPAIGMSKSSAITHADAITASEALEGLAWPCVKIPNPDEDVYGAVDQITIKSSGSIAGTLGRNTEDYKTSVATQPGNEIYGRLKNVVDVEDRSILDDAVREEVSAHRINPVVYGRDADGVNGVWLNDVQAGKVSGNFKSIGENRFVAMVLKAVMKHLETIRTTGNTGSNRRLDHRNISRFLGRWVGKDIYASENPEEAFYVNTDIPGKGLNNPLEQTGQKYSVLIGLALAEPRRFVTLLYTKDTRGVDAFIQGTLSI